MFVLWKDHTAVREADEINDLARTWGGPDYTRFEGGIYSSEWFWAKVLHVLRADAEVAGARPGPGASTATGSPGYWWAPRRRRSCVAGAPPPATRRCGTNRGAACRAASFWGGSDPRLAELRGRLYDDSYTADQCAGTLTAEWAARLGLSAGIAVAVGGFDAHLGAVGGGIRPGALSKILGTSTCDMIVTDAATLGDRLIPGICGQVDGSIIPGLVGLEAGQSAYGDVYAWFRDLLSWPLRTLPAAQREPLEAGLLDDLADAAAALPVDPAGVLSLDWFNGRRTPNADATLQAAITGLSLGADAPALFRSLVEATAYGSRAINEHFAAAGIAVDEIIALGGISQRSDFAVQVAADVLGMPIKVAATEEGSALGAAMCAATAAGHHATVEEAQAAMGAGFHLRAPPRARRPLHEGYHPPRAGAERRPPPGGAADGLSDTRGEGSPTSTKRKLTSGASMLCKPAMR